MAAIEPYINFAGKTAEALDFYKSVFGGKAEMQLAKDTPNAGNTPPEKLDQVFHGAVITEAGFTILGSDMMSAGEQPVNNVISLALMTDSEAQLRDWFNKLSDGGKVVWPVRDSEWGSLYGQCVDKYGIQWMFNYDKNKA